MRAIFLLMLVLTASGAYSQFEVGVNFSTPDQYLFPEEMGYRYILGDDVALRSRPTSRSRMKVALPIATRIKILERSDSVEVKKGVSSHWYKVKTDSAVGWIWGGLIAQSMSRSNKDLNLIFLGGYEKTENWTDKKQGGAWYQIRAVKHHQQVRKISVKSFGSDFAEVINIGSKGLSAVDDIISLRVPCHGGCGCIAGETIVFWDNGEFYKVAELMGTPDGEYSHGDHFIYPTDMEGIPGQIIKFKTNVGREDYDRKRLRRIITKEYYVWSNGKLMLLDQKTKIKKYWMSL